jgi:hypothetical protein
MARAMVPEKQIEYEELSKFISFFATHCQGIDPDWAFHPSVNLQVAEELFGKSKALEGARQAVNDALEETRRVSPEYLTRVDAALTEQGIVTLSELRRRYSRHYKAILKRGKVKDETEYYLLKGILDDGSANVTSDERSILQSMSDIYEQSLG